MLPSPVLTELRTDLFHGLFEWRRSEEGPPTLATRPAAPREIPDPHTGRPLKIATVELSDRTVCPSCARRGGGGYVSFESDLRLAFACPRCLTLVWIAGA